MHTQMTDFQPSGEPLDIVETVVVAEQHEYERTSTGELHFTVKGAWRDHPIWFSWSESVETLHICLSVDVKANAARRSALCELVALINERLWMGHFDIWSDDGAVVYRNALTLPAGLMPTADQISALLNAAVEAGERLYPAYNYMTWAGKGPREAVAAALFETAGEA